MYAPKIVNIDPAIWPLTEGVHSLERHEVVQFLSADSRINHEAGGRKNRKGEELLQPVKRTNMRKRKYDKSHAEIILRVRQYFEKEFRFGKRLKLDHVVERTSAATDV